VEASIIKYSVLKIRDSNPYIIATDRVSKWTDSTSCFKILYRYTTVGVRSVVLGLTQEFISASIPK